VRLELARDPQLASDTSGQQVCGFTADDYAQVLADLLPRGWAWSRELTSVLMLVLEGLAAEFARITARDCDLLAESYPGTALETLTDWERICGLPDPCTGTLGSIQERRAAILAKLAMRGGQSRQYYIDVAAALGFVITITEYQPFRVGKGRAGDYLAGEDWLFYWRVTSWEQNQKIYFFRAGQSATSERLRHWGNSLLECVITAIAPAHTIVRFAYQHSWAVWDDPADPARWDGGNTIWDQLI
jgi:uncharacterized protein YmfQ (DUF2313 family)